MISKRLLFLFAGWCAILFASSLGRAQDAAAATPPSSVEKSTPAEMLTKQGALISTLERDKASAGPGFLEHLVDMILESFDITTSGNTPTHYAIAAVFLVAALVLRRVVTKLVFGQLRRIAARTQTTLDDKLFPALEPPAATFVLLVGIFAGISVLKLTPQLDRAVSYGSHVAFTLVVFWALLRSLSALLDHLQEIAYAKHLGVAAFMPWIKKTLATIFIIFGVLVVIQSFGVDVKAALAGLGIGGLAFALAAQDTLANVFGSVVVAIDQPFKIGEAVKIGAHDGVVEDIGLRSTKLRTAARNLIIIPNKTVAAEAVINNSRFIARRVEQVLGLTYATTPAQMEALVTEIRGLITSEEEVDTSSVNVYFRDFNASSLDIWLAYNVRDPDFGKHMALRQRVNLKVMRAVAARGLAFAFPTQTIELANFPGDAKPGPRPPEQRHG